MNKLIRRHPYILTFGILQIFFSAPGQTFLISLFVSHLFKNIGISLSLFTAIYSAATLAASLLLNPAGHLIDKYPIKRIIVAVTTLMALGCWLLATANNIVMVFIAFFILRLIGQGVFGLTASTLIIKKFHKNRGKAMSVIMLGFPFSEMVYPVIALTLLNVLGWRMTYVAFGLTNLVLMLPLQLMLLTKANLKHGHFLPGEELINPERMPGRPDERKFKIRKDATLKEALRDIKFYLILVASCVPPLVVTGLFWHQSGLFESKAWPISLAATGFTVYAISKAVCSVIIGPVVDKHGPVAPFISIILLLGGGTLCAALGQSQGIIHIYFGIIGAALGFSSPVMNVVWPHFYGTRHIGSIKGMIATFRNGLTGFGPLPMAMALENGWTIDQILFTMSICIFAIAVLPFIVWRMDR